MSKSALAEVIQHPAVPKNRLRLKRAFDAAQIHPALTSWISQAVPAENDIRQALRQVRARSREAVQNDDHMRYFLRLVEANVIGREGFTVQSRAQTPTGRSDRTARATIEEHFAKQSLRGNWDVTGTHSRASFARLAMRTVAQDGEVLIRIHNPDDSLPTGWAVELIDAESLDFDYNKELPNGNIVRMGVEMNRHRRPVAYHMFPEPAPYTGYTSYGTGQRERIPANEILHVYLPEWTWVSRGVPWAATGLRRIKMLSGYEEAAITAARMAAVKSAAYQSTPDADPGVNPLGADLDAQFSSDVEPGQIELVPPGWELKPLDWSWPNTDHGQFVKAALRGISAGLGISYNALANDLEGVNYSSLRQGALQERDLWMTLQSWWTDWVERPLYEHWLEFMLRSGRITRRNGNLFNQESIEDQLKAHYQGRRWAWVDPLKDLQAAELAVKMRTRSISDVIREQGREPEEVWAELGQDLERLRSMGLTPEAVGLPASTDQEDNNA